MSAVAAREGGVHECRGLGVASAQIPVESDLDRELSICGRPVGRWRGEDFRERPLLSRFERSLEARAESLRVQADERLGEPRVAGDRRPVQGSLWEDEQDPHDLGAGARTEEQPRAARKVDGLLGHHRAPEGSRLLGPQDGGGILEPGEEEIPKLLSHPDGLTKL